MPYLAFKSEYDRFPRTKVADFDGDIHVDEAIVPVLSSLAYGILAFEVYPGSDMEKLFLELILKLNPDNIYNIETCRKPYTRLKPILEPYLTEDRVFGRMNKLTIFDLYDEKKLDSLLAKVHNSKGFTIIYGFGASLAEYDNLVYVDMTRWEIQLRFRKGMPNFTADNPDEDPLRKFKRGYFLEWRIADIIKLAHLPRAKYLIDASDEDHFTMITRDAFEAGLDQLVSGPFRLIPYFDPGVWGGNWMKEVCNLPENNSNYAWCFDGVPEENALCLVFGDKEYHFPALDLVFFRSRELLGEKVHQRFGKEYPIRFDFLDTMNGGNLSLQVHPTTSYIQKTFGMTYTQDESYYILDAKPDSSVYLGLKEGIDPKRFIADLETANLGEAGFDDSLYINRFPAKKHDHFLIPAGTVHCSGKNTMVLEISSTPYIFTFKLWDWDRLGLDGLPRPVHINHGKHVIQYDRTTSWVEKNLVNRIERISSVEAKTGLHELEPIETRRFQVEKELLIENHGSVNQLNLVEGKALVVFSPDDQFPPFEVHYAETFIVPEKVKTYLVKPRDPQETCLLIQASIR